MGRKVATTRKESWLEKKQLIVTERFSLSDYYVPAIVPNAVSPLPHQVLPKSCEEESGGLCVGGGGAQ